MKTHLLRFIVSVCLGSGFTHAQDAKSTATPEAMSVVVAIRYLQVEGKSHGHLYLFDRQANLIRQLTSDDSGQDHDPVFSKDGREIVYQRRTLKGEQWRSILTSGKADHALRDPPRWHAALAVEPAGFSDPPFVPTTGRQRGERVATASTAGEIVFKAPDGATELLLKTDTERQDPKYPTWFPKVAFVRELLSGKETSLESVPIFSPQPVAPDVQWAWRAPLPCGLVPNNEHLNKAMRTDSPVAGTVQLLNQSPFLWHPPLRAVFFTQHRGSTDGEGLFAVDLNELRLFELTPNGGRIIPLPGLPLFACVGTQRYLRLGDGPRTVNCSYLDLWDAQMRRTHFAEARTAVFYGASILLAGKLPHVFSIVGDK